jgi:hypothetical protein
MGRTPPRDTRQRLPGTGFYCSQTSGGDAKDVAAFRDSPSKITEKSQCGNPGGGCGTMAGKMEEPGMTEKTASRSKNKAGARPGRLRICGWLLTAGCWLLMLWWLLAPPAPQTVESVYSRHFYPVLVSLLAPLSSAIPFSLSMLIIAAVITGFPLLWIANWVYRRRVRAMPHWRGLLWGFKWLVILVPLFYAWFLIFWGMGYQRIPPEARLGLDTSKITPAEAADLRARLLRIIKENAALPDQRDPDRAIAAIARAHEILAREWNGVDLRLPRRVKATPKGLLLANGTSGVCLPLMLEPHVDGALPPAAFVQVAAHELSHIAGINSEAEANLAGYAAGLRADDAFARYAAALDAYTDLARQLPREAMKSAMERLPEQARSDLRAAAEAAMKYRIQWFRKWSWRAYNQYLKSQGIEEGVKNYSRGITLFAWCWRKGLIDLPEAAPLGPDTRENAPTAQKKRPAHRIPRMPLRALTLPPVR